MCLRKSILSLLLGAILVLQAISLGFSITSPSRTTYGDIAAYTLHIVFALYTLALSFRAVRATYAAHAMVVVHLSALTVFAALLLFVTAILPSTPFPLPKEVEENTPLFSSSTSVWGDTDVQEGAACALWYAVLALYVTATGVAVTTPRGPKLHFPSERVYSDKTLMQVTSRYEDNVDEITGACVYLLARLELYLSLGLLRLYVEWDLCTLSIYVTEWLQIDECLAFAHSCLIGSLSSWSLESSCPIT